MIELRDTGNVVVYMHWVMGNSIDIIGFADSEEEAKAYINQEMEGKQYNGTGCYCIKPIKHIEKLDDE